MSGPFVSHLGHAVNGHAVLTRISCVMFLDVVIVRQCKRWEEPCFAQPRLYQQLGTVEAMDT